MLRLLWTLSVHTLTYLRRYMPTNRLLDGIRSCRGLKWGVPAMLLATQYLFAAAMCWGLIEDGGPGWLNLLVIFCLWNALKMIWIGPVAVLLLASAAGRERLDVANLSPRSRLAGLCRRAR